MTSITTSVFLHNVSHEHNILKWRKHVLFSRSNISWLRFSPPLKCMMKTLIQIKHECEVNGRRGNRARSIKRTSSIGWGDGINYLFNWRLVNYEQNKLECMGMVNEIAWRCQNQALILNILTSKKPQIDGLISHWPFKGFLYSIPNCMHCKWI